jgi:glycosyltransferase involved in cell wall biosynthesis
MKILIITPVRNEEEHIRTTLDCMVNQTILPNKWIIVNDGSTDNTDRIIRKYENKHSFIRCISLPNRGHRSPAKGVIDTFYKGYNTVKNEYYDIISKFDADLEFPPYTLEKIINAFKNDPKLGITGGTRYEQRRDNGPYEKVLVPRDFVGGPFKFYRMDCFYDIGGLIRRAGWDGVDTIKANMKGWKTGEIDSLRIIHLKPTGSASGEGLIKACEKYGDVSYYMGGYFGYFILRVMFRSFQEHNFQVGFQMIKGFRKAKRNNETRETKEFRKYLKQKQRENVLYWIKVFINKKSREIL